jgi:AhpD family alkylhydroperoxidase
MTSSAAGASRHRDTLTRPHHHIRKRNLTMQSRMKHPIAVLPKALQALLAVGKAVEVEGLPLATRKLIELRASQINSCSVCVDMHARELKKAGESDERIFGVAAWREMPYFTEAERAALALTEAVTRLSDRADPVPDDIWQDARRHYEDEALAALIVDIGMINLWNRLNATVKQMAPFG